MNLRSLDLNLLLVLDALLAERNVTRAAQRLHLSQPAMSNALARLRRHFDDPLLVRTGNRMAATARGESLAQPLREALQRLQSALADSQPLDPARLARTFCLGASDHVDFVLLPRLLARLRQEAPEVRVSVRRFGGAPPSSLLANGELDLAIGYFDNTPERLHRTELFREAFVCLARRGHPLTKGGLTLKTFTQAAHLLISPQGGGFTSFMDDLLKARGLSRNVVLSVPHFLSAPYLVANSDLVVTMAERVARAAAQTLPVELFAPPLRVQPFTVAELWHERAHHDPAHQWLRRLITEVSEGI